MCDTSVDCHGHQGKGREGIDFPPPHAATHEERLLRRRTHPGSFFRAKARPPERAILTTRLIDRRCGSLFSSWYGTTSRWSPHACPGNERFPADVLARDRAPRSPPCWPKSFNGPMAAVRVGLLATTFVLNPTTAKIRAAVSWMVWPAPVRVVMVEAGRQPAARHKRDRSIASATKPWRADQGPTDPPRRLGIEQVFRSAGPTPALRISWSRKPGAARECSSSSASPSGARRPADCDIQGRRAQKYAVSPTTIRSAGRHRRLGTTYKHQPEAEMRARSSRGQAVDAAPR